MSEPIDFLGERARRAEPIATYTLTLRVARDAEATVWDWSAEQAIGGHMSGRQNRALERALARVEIAARRERRAVRRMMLARRKRASQRVRRQRTRERWEAMDSLHRALRSAERHLVGERPDRTRDPIWRRIWDAERAGGGP